MQHSRRVSDAPKGWPRRAGRRWGGSSVLSWEWRLSPTEGTPLVTQGEWVRKNVQPRPHSSHGSRTKEDLKRSTHSSLRRQERLPNTVGGSFGARSSPKSLVPPLVLQAQKPTSGLVQHPSPLRDRVPRPTDIRHGRASWRGATRTQVLAAIYAAHPERPIRKPPGLRALPMPRRSTAPVTKAPDHRL